MTFDPIQKHVTLDSSKVGEIVEDKNGVNLFFQRDVLLRQSEPGQNLVFEKL